MNYINRLLICKLGWKARSEFSTRDHLLNYINWWGNNDAEKIWFSIFLRNNLKIRRKINFFSVFGGKANYINRRCQREKDAINIFYTPENISLTGVNKNNRSYANYMSFLVDLSLGFDYVNDNPRYLRFPYWLISLFSPTSTYEDVKQIVTAVNSKCIKYDERFIDCSMICSHDTTGTRARICDSITTLFDIKYEGGWRSNSNILKDKFNNNKIKYLNKVKFNVCPENSNQYGYVTEKLFEAFFAGAIPIYWGGDASPELDIINESSFIYWDGSDRCYETIERLNNNKNDYIDFVSQPVFKVGAEEKIWKYFQYLKDKVDFLQEK